MAETPTTTIDRELLELAAKAHGYLDDATSDDNSFGLRRAHSDSFYVADANGWRDWNPLTGDGDALRLAVRLGIFLRTDFIRLLGELLGSGMDHYDATRLAILRIAAEIGRMKP